MAPASAYLQRYTEAYRAARLLVLQVCSLADWPRGGTRKRSDLRPIRAAALSLSVGFLPGREAARGEITGELAAMTQSLHEALTRGIVSAQEATEIQAQIEAVRREARPPTELA